MMSEGWMKWYAIGVICYYTLNVFVLSKSQCKRQRKKKGNKSNLSKIISRKKCRGKIFDACRDGRGGFDIIIYNYYCERILEHGYGSLIPRKFYFSLFLCLHFGLKAQEQHKHTNNDNSTCVHFECSHVSRFGLRLGDESAKSEQRRWKVRIWKTKKIREKRKRKRENAYPNALSLYLKRFKNFHIVFRRSLSPKYT